MSASDAPLPRRRPQKSPSAFRTISEVAGELDLPQHVLRFWETKFSQVRPLKRGGGRRYYRPEDIRLLRCIRELLYRDGYTIKGVQRLLRETGVKALIAGVSPVPNADATEAGAGAEPPPAGPPAPAAGLAPQTRAVIEEVLADLVEIRRLLRGEKGPPG